VKITYALTLAGGRLAARNACIIAVSRAGIDMDGLRKEESKERDKLEVEYHDNRSDSRKELDYLGDNRETKCVFPLSRK
jgi:3'-phosphoadenosine 5'-phosphosulfate sulfotransferase (PAPS reductase)/FAD synthetase